MGLFSNLFKTTPKYDMDSIEGIRAIPVPAKNYNTGNPTEDCIYYVLQKKATEHKKNKNIDLAIECLKKSNELSDYEKRPLLTETQYKRLLKFLEKEGRNEEYNIELEKMKQRHPEFFGLPAQNITLEEYRKKLANEKEDALIVSTSKRCSSCGPYNNKIFSLGGKSKKYPILPKSLQTARCLDCGCYIGYSIHFDL